jgi:hypothetical protein
MNKPSLHIVSALVGSIGEITHDLLPYFENTFDVTLEGFQEPKDYKLLLSHFVNPIIVKHENFKKFKKKILIQPIDGTSIKPEAIKCINQYDLIITPGLAGQRIMQLNGVIKPIVVIPNFYKDNIFNKPIDIFIPELPKDKIIFYHESTCHPRKGIEYLYEGFIRAFSDTKWADKVVLVIKDSPFNEITFDKIERLKRETIKLQAQYKNPARIIKISQALSEDTLKKLWYNTDIYVSLSKIEGFGIPLLRMAALGKPIIALDSTVSGYTDFLTPDNSYLIPTNLVTAEDEFMWLYKKDSKWSVPINIDGVQQALQSALLNHMIGKQKRLNVKVEHMHIDKVAEKYIETIKKV